MKFQKLTDGRHALVLEESESKLGLKEGDYEAHKTPKGIELREVEMDRKEKTFYDKLYRLKFKDRIEGILEKSLSEEEKLTLLELVKKGKVLKYKGGDQYRNHLYVTDEEFTRMNSENQSKATSGASVQGFASNGYYKTKSQEEAVELSQKHAEEIRSGEVLGVKSFSGDYYVIRRGVFEDCYPKVLASLSKGEKTAEDVASEIKADADKCEIVLGLLNDQGQVFEKSRGSYRLVK